MADLQLRPEVKKVLLERFSYSTNGETAALNAVSSMFCEGVRAYPANTKGVIQAILQLGRCLGAWAESVEDRLDGKGGADLCCLLPPNPNTPYASAGIIGDDCGTEDCPPTPHPHPHDPNPCHGAPPHLHGHKHHPHGGVECLAPEPYEWVNSGIVGNYCSSKDAPPDCLIPSRLPYSNAGAIGCGDPSLVDWVDYFWPQRDEFCNAGFTGNNCEECAHGDADHHHHDHAHPGDCGVCRRGGVENYRPEFIEYNNAGTWSEDCPSAYAKPVCLLPDFHQAYANSGVVGTGDPDTENYVDHLWPNTCEYLNSGLIGTGCAIGGDEWLDALDLGVEKGDCFIPYLSEFANSGITGGSWKCDVNKKPNLGEHWFTPVWETDFANAGALLIDPSAESEPVFGGVECWAPSENEFTQCGVTGSGCPDDQASPSCLLPQSEPYANAGIVAVMTKALPNWWDHYLPDGCYEYDNAGITGTNCEPPEECCECPVAGNELPVLPDINHSHEDWLPGECDFANAGFKTKRPCNVCEPCNNTDPHGQPVVVISDQPPIEPCEGTLWFIPSRLEMMVYYCDQDTCQWVPTVAAGGGSGGASAVISDQAPVGATCGDLWMDSKRMEMRTFYDDGDTRQWVPVSLAAANSPDTERMLRAEVAAMRAELNELKMAIAGRSPE